MEKAYPGNFEKFSIEHFPGLRARKSRKRLVPLLLEVIFLHLSLLDLTLRLQESWPLVLESGLPKVNQESGPQPADSGQLKPVRSSGPGKGRPGQYLSADALGTVADAVVAAPGSLPASPRAGAGGPRPLSSWPEQIPSSGAHGVTASGPPRLE